MARATNRQIVAELKRGDRAGCVHLVDSFQSRLLGQAVRVFNIPEPDAEELVSDVLLVVVNKIGSFEFKRSDADFLFWVVGIFRNRVRDFKRHRALTHGLVTSLESLEPENGGRYSDDGKAVLAAAVRLYEEAVRISMEAEEGGAEGSPASGLDMITLALEELETWERVLLRCRAHKIPYAEIASYTEMDARTLKVYHPRVKRKLVEILAHRIPKAGSR